MNRYLSWVIVCLLLWLATVTFRLSYAQDVTDWPVWLVSLGVAVAFPIGLGYNLALWKFYRRTHHLCVEESKVEKVVKVEADVTVRQHEEDEQ